MRHARVEVELARPVSNIDFVLDLLFFLLASSSKMVLNNTVRCITYSKSILNVACVWLLLEFCSATVLFTCARD